MSCSPRPASSSERSLGWSGLGRWSLGGHGARSPAPSSLLGFGRDRGAILRQPDRSPPFAVPGARKGGEAVESQKQVNRLLL